MDAYSRKHALICSTFKKCTKQLAYYLLILLTVFLGTLIHNKLQQQAQSTFGSPVYFMVVHDILYALVLLLIQARTARRVLRPTSFSFVACAVCFIFTVCLLWLQPRYFASTYNVAQPLLLLVAASDLFDIAAVLILRRAKS